jgi:hypothetical protein
VQCHIFWILQVYNEQVYDLLAEGRAALKVKENSTGHIFISGLSKQSVSSTEAALGVMHRGSRHRQRAGTALNQKSSRSHTIFTVCALERLPYRRFCRVRKDVS